MKEKSKTMTVSAMLVIAATGLVCLVARGAQAQSFEQQVLETSRKISVPAQQAKHALTASMAQASENPKGEKPKVGIYAGTDNNGLSCWIRILKVESPPPGSKSVLDLVTTETSYGKVTFVMGGYDFDYTKLNSGYGDESWHVSLALYSSQEGKPLRFIFNFGGELNTPIHKECNLL